MSSWDQANIWQKPGAFWISRKKISKIIKDYFYLPFFLLIMLWGASKAVRMCRGHENVEGHNVTIRLKVKGRREVFMEKYTVL